VKGVASSEQLTLGEKDGGSRDVPLHDWRIVNVLQPVDFVKGVEREGAYDSPGAPVGFQQSWNIEQLGLALWMRAAVHNSLRD
jgi:hypothetical protein